MKKKVPQCGNVGLCVCVCLDNLLDRKPRNSAVGIKKHTPSHTHMKKAISRTYL